MATTTLLGQLASGEAVVDRFNSHLQSHSLSTELLVTALSRINSSRRNFLIEEIRFDQTVGNTVCVVTGAADRIVFAQRPKRSGLTRFVVNRQPEPCRSMVVILKSADAPDFGAYVLVTAFIGNKPEPEPWDERALSRGGIEAVRRSQDFWATHALVLGHETVICNECGVELPKPCMEDCVREFVLCLDCRAG